jgi:hypothetical protein
VPDFLRDGAVWIPELFRLLSTKIHREGLLPLILAIAPGRSVPQGAGWT